MIIFGSLIYILNIQTIIKYVNQNNEDLAIISLDKEKAFDRVKSTLYILRFKEI